MGPAFTQQVVHSHSLNCEMIAFLMQVYRAAPRPEAHAPGTVHPPCVLKIVNLGANCKIREDYKPILRSEGAFLEHFDQPGFVRCYETWGGAMKHECASCHFLMIAQ